MCVLLELYLSIGIVLVALTPARHIVFEADKDTKLREQPRWKLVVFWAIVLGVAILLWPFFLPSWFRQKKNTVVWDSLHKNTAYPQLKQREKKSYKEWLQKKIMIEEAEQKHMVLDKRLWPKVVPFGFQHEQWLRFKNQI